MHSPFMLQLPVVSAACSLRQRLHDVISHTLSAVLLLRVQTNLEADEGLHTLWLLFLTSCPSGIMKLTSLQHTNQASLITATVKTIVSVFQAASAEHAVSQSLLIAKHSSMQWSSAL